MQILTLLYDLFIKVPRHLRSLVGVIFVFVIFSFLITITYTTKDYIIEIKKQREKFIGTDKGDIKMTDIVGLDGVCHDVRFTYSLPITTTSADANLVLQDCEAIHKYFIEHRTY